MKLFIDVESYCDQDLKAVGVYKYAETAKVILVAYSVDGGNVAVWDRAYAPTPPADLIEAMTACDTATSHNAQFERVVMSGPAQANLPQIPLTKWRCSMAQASSHALPAGLDELCEVLNLPSDQAKSKDGKKLIRLFCGPQPANRKIQHPTKQTHPDEWERFVEYCRQDVVALIAIDNLLPIWNWNASAIAEWHLNQVINDRGFKVDRELTKAAAAGAVVEKARIGERFRELTNGAVDRPSLRAQFLNYLNTTYALGIEDTTTATFQALLDKGVDNPVVAELLNLSMRGNKSSTAKYATLDEMTQNDGRFRGPLQFCGAGRTRRDAGRGFQGQNLPSRGLPKQEATDAFIEQIKAGTYDFSNPQTMRLASAALRGCIVPSAGNQLLIADLANIEGRLVAFLAGETWKIEAFKEYDKGTGPDLYNVTACSIVGGDPWNLPKSIRNSFGKVPELALGYQGGVAGIQQFAKGYGVKFADHWTTIQEKLAPQQIEWAQDSAKKAWAKRRMVEMGISEIEWTASEAVKLAWRHKHPKVKQIWQDLEGLMWFRWSIM